MGGRPAQTETAGYCLPSRIAKLPDNRRPNTKPADYIALSVTILVQAPSGALVITGSEPPFNSVCTVRS